VASQFLWSRDFHRPVCFQNMNWQCARANSPTGLSLYKRYGGLERRVSTTRPIPQNSLDRIEKNYITNVFSTSMQCLLWSKKLIDFAVVLRISATATNLHVTFVFPVWYLVYIASVCMTDFREIILVLSSVRRNWLTSIKEIKSIKLSYSPLNIVATILLLTITT